MELNTQQNKFLSGTLPQRISGKDIQDLNDLTNIGVYYDYGNPVKLIINKPAKVSSYYNDYAIRVEVIHRYSDTSGEKLQVLTTTYNGNTYYRSSDIKDGNLVWNKWVPQSEWEGLDTSSYGFVSDQRGWKISKTGNILSQSIYTATENFGDYTFNNNKITSNDEKGSFYYSSEIYFPLDYPIDSVQSKNTENRIGRGSVTGSLFGSYGFITNARVVNGTKVVFQIAHPLANDLDFNSTQKISLYVSGKHATPPETPLFNATQNTEIEQSIISIVNSYFDAGTGKGADGVVYPFSYGPNWTYNNNNTVYGAGEIWSGTGLLMECDVFVNMVLLGVPFNKSPFYGKYQSGYGGPAVEQNILSSEFNGTVYSSGFDAFIKYWTELNEDNTPAHAPNWSFALKKQDSSAGRKYPNLVNCETYLNKRVYYTGLQNWLFWDQGLVFKPSETNLFDPTTTPLRTGDILIVRRKDSKNKFFDEITHVGVITIEDSSIEGTVATGVKKIYLNQIGSSETTIYKGVTLDSTLSKVSLRDYLKSPKRHYSMEYYFARPDYSERDSANNLT